jgi:hypothetical protein
LGLSEDDCPMLGLGLWGDGARFAKEGQNTLELLLFNVLSGSYRRRFMICSFGKKSVCQCGCLGRCTFNAVFDIIKYSMDALATGVFPRVRHDGTQFAGMVGDKMRAKHASKPIGCKGGVIQLRGDWSWLKQVSSTNSKTLKQKSI